jgi:hypothetical protein
VHGGVILALVLSATVLTDPLPRPSSGVEGWVNSYTGEVIARAVAPGTAGSSAGDDAGDAGNDDAAESTADEPQATGPGSPCFAESGGADIEPGPVPCTSDHGVWSNEFGCYVSPSPMDPQPPRSSGAVDSFTGEALTDEGAFYDCWLPDGGGAGTVWLDSPPSLADAALLPTPGEVAQMAVDQMGLRAISIGIAPDPDGVGIVGMPVWLWVENPDDETYGPATATATARGVTVTATARVHRVVWDLGDSTTIVCTGPGTEYQDSFGRQPSPDCGHTYTHESGDLPGGTYTVTATSQWVVEWEGAGQTGTLTLDGLTSQVQVTVGEGQVLVS